MKFSTLSCWDRRLNAQHVRRQFKERLPPLLACNQITKRLSNTMKISNVSQRFQRKSKRWLKQQWWTNIQPLPEYGQILMVVGCQRSGTTLLMNCFDLDFRTIVFRDDSQISGARGNRLRQKPYSEVAPLLSKCRAPLIVSKPLLDSQRTSELLTEYPRSNAIWMFRSYIGVVGSSLNRFNGQVENLRRVVEEPEDWRGEKVSDETREFIMRHYSPKMPREDAAALVWFARNQLFFEQGLESSTRVHVLCYEHLVSKQDLVLKLLYQFLGVKYPKRSITHIIHQNSLSRGSDLEIKSEIKAKCHALESRLSSHAAFNLSTG